MDHPLRPPAGEDVEAVLTEALNFLMNSWRHAPALRSAIDRAIGCLEGGDTNDQAHAKTLKAYVNYPGSAAAQQAAYQLHAAILTAEGRRASGLPKRTRGLDYRVKHVSITSELFQILLKLQLDKKYPENKKNQRVVGRGEVRRAFDRHFGESMSPTTRAKVRKEINKKVERYADFLHALRTAKQRNTPL